MTLQLGEFQPWQYKTMISRYRSDVNETDTEESEEGSAIGEEEIAEAEAEAAVEVEAKSASEDENYACVKAVAAGTVYR